MSRAALLLVAASLLVPSCGGGGSWFDDPFWQDTDIVVADVDGDGRADVLTLGSYVDKGEHLLGRLNVYRQTAPGVFAAPVSTAADTYPWRIAIGDLDGNAFLDVVVTHPTDGEISVFLQDPGAPGSFGPELRLSLPGSIYGAAIADLDGDGRGDVAAGNNQTGGGIFLLLQDPAVPGAFLAPALVAPGRSVEFLAAGDLDGDRRADLAFGASIYDAGTQSVTTWLGLLFQLPAGGFGAPEYLAPVAGRYVKGLHIHDFDGDGDRDVVVAYGAPSGGGTTRISLFLQALPAGEFDPPIDTAASDSFETTFLADLDGSGREDVGLARWPADPGIDLWLHSGAGPGAPLTFGGAIGVADADFNGHAAGGRLDGDALDDIAALFDGHLRIAKQLSPGLFGPFVPVP